MRLLIFRRSTLLLIPTIAASVGVLIFACWEPETHAPPPDDEYTEALVSQTLDRLGSGDPAWTDDIREIASTFTHYDDFVNSISMCDDIEVYEGLPHPTWESKLLSSEKKNNETIVLGNFYFYADPIAVTGRDARRLRDLYCSRGSFYPFQGYKSCGGYHPDWCVVWKNNKVSYEVQFCFGCCEMKTSDGFNSLHCDIGNMKKKAFESILNKYRTKRPKP